jgi:Ca2+-binding RTX toxin-like protein
VSRRLALTASIAVIAAVAAPAGASAATIDEYAIYHGDPGVNTVTVSFDGVSATITDPAGISVDPFAPCTPISGTSATCTDGQGYAFRLDTGDDTWTYTGGAPALGIAAYRVFQVHGEGGSDVINGSPYRDELTASGYEPDPTGHDQIYGHGGEDSLGDDDGTSNRLEGGPGDDHIKMGNVGKAANTLLGGPGKDFMLGGDGVDTVNGEDGNDDVYGGDGDDLVLGGPGNDGVEGGGGTDVADGGPGDDGVQASFHGGGCSPDTLIGGTGRDSLYAACGVPTLKMRDGAKDTARCLPKVTRAIVQRDQIDELEGGACARKTKKSCKKKARKGAAAAAKKKCRKKGKGR